MTGVLILTYEEHDPRFTAEQRKAMNALACFDANACILGLDYMLHPVVSASLGVPRAPRAYAIDRAGTPCIPAWNAGTFDRLYEEWDEVNAADRAAASPAIR